MSTGYTDLSGSGLVLGTVVNGAPAQSCAISAPSAGVLQLTSTGTAPARLTGVAAPTADSDAAPKSYVDSSIRSAVNGLQLEASAQLVSTVPVALTTQAWTRTS